MNYKYLTGLIFVAAIAATSVIFSSENKACAAEIAPQPCDTRYWDSMAHRAWMEAEREIIMNQNLIFKPDSVLEYTCFDQFLNHNAEHAGNIFVHTTYFGQMILEKNGDNSMKKALETVVANSLQSYDNSNFGYDLLGGRAIYLDLNPSSIDFDGTVEYATYANCNWMAAVWETAKCLNFVDNSNFDDTDGFYPFETLEAFGPDSEPVTGYNSMPDPRLFPTPCGEPDNPPWQEAIDKAENKGDQVYDFAVPLQEAFTQIRTKLEPGNCENPAILTGVTVRLSPGAGSERYPDGVCTNPGCTYVMSADSSGRSAPTAQCE